MPTRERRLKKEAMDGFNYRGHVSKDKKWIVHGYNKDKFLKYCDNCQLQVRVDLNPAPNDIDISGETLAENCDDVIKKAERK